MPSRLVSIVEATADAARFPAELAGEADHRIANNLAIIAGLIHSESKKFSSNKLVSSRDVRDLLAAISARIDSVARLHRLIRHFGGAASVSVGDYLKDVAEAAVSSINGEDDVFFELVADRVVNPRTAAAIGLFVCEAVTNSVKYAHPTGIPGKIRVSAETDGDHFVVAVTDDGVGLPEDFDPEAATSTGFVVMKALATQAGGLLSFESLPIGLATRLAVPLAMLETAA